MQKDLITQEIVRNLTDAGCTEQEIEKFMNELLKGDKKTQTQLLEQHRECLLHKVHDEEHRIDCLDYLLYQIQDGKLAEIKGE